MRAGGRADDPRHRARGDAQALRQWKSGFYRIAVAAGVPILPVAFDYSRKVVFFAPLFHPTGDYERDLEELQVPLPRRDGR